MITYTDTKGGDTRMNTLVFRGIGMAAVLFVFSAAVALACPPKTTTTPSCQPQPCGSCGCNTSTNAAFFSGSQNQTVNGDFGPVKGTQEMGVVAQVNVGEHIEAKTQHNSWQATQADAVSMMNQNQAATVGASATGPNNQFPGIWQAKTQDISSQTLNTWGTNIAHKQKASTWQHSIVDGVVSQVDANLETKKVAVGTGDVIDEQKFNSGTQSQWWAVPPFPASHTINFPTGNNVGRVIQEINFKNIFQFSPF